MAIVKMSKFTLLAFDSQKEILLENLQKFQGVQFINLQEKITEELEFLKGAGDHKKASEIDEELVKVKFSLEFMNRFIEREKGFKAIKKGKKNLKYDEVKELSSKINWLVTYENLKKYDVRLNELKNEISRLEGEIEILRPWIKLDASFDDLKSIHSSNYFLGTINKNVADEFLENFNNHISVSYIEKLGVVKDEINLLIIYHKMFAEQSEDLFKQYGLSKVDLKYSGTPRDIIKDYEKRIENYKKEELHIVDKIKEYKDKIEELEIVYEYYKMEENKARVGENFLKTDKVLLFEGWTPEEKKIEFEDIIKQCCGNEYSIEFMKPSPEDNVPILLKNNSIVEPYEIITSIYSLPQYNEVDPTPLLAPFFFIFFGMMLSDAGYGAIMFIASALALRLLPLDESVQKFMRLFESIGISTVIWGMIYGSYFGDAPKLFFPGGIKPLWLDPAANPISVLLLAGIMGIIHLYVGLGIKAYELIRSGKVMDALFDVGFWYLTLTGIMLLLTGPSSGFSSLAVVGKYMAIIGAIGLVATQGRSNKGIVGKIAGGLFGLYGITGYLGDVLSYSRLLALGLATGLIGSSFNLMISLLGKGIFAWIFGIIIFLGGHIFNLAINALGAYVHACRLQYLEFFGKFYSGGGKQFTPFKAKNKYINIIK
ncbi:V-type ATP synthase subunit I [Clostridium lundense]|uniref:V-type ATP synthase subunit I n=1 Tax=Clostridium lundense TaxID=319475 RepID=UPI0004838BC3|nr:V-type ATP synthase subunit I [Clostridium lundense]